MSGTSAARLSRLLAMVPWLYAHDGVTISEAAHHFGVSAAQLERDLWLLIVCGLPGYGPDQLIDIQFWGADARIHVLDPQALERPLRLSGDESMALLIALRVLAQIPGGHDRQALLSAMEKLQQAAGDSAQEEAVVVESGTSGEVIQAVDVALANHRVLRIRYSGSARDAITDREVEPIAVRTLDGRSYLEAWCRAAEAIRTFRTDRILRAEVLDESFSQAHSQASASGDPMDLLATAGEPEVVMAQVLVADAARWALDVYPMEVVGDAPQGGVMARIAVHDPAWLVRLVLGMRGQVVVQEPALLRAAVADAAEGALRGYYGRTRSSQEGN